MQSVLEQKAEGPRTGSVVEAAIEVLVEIAHEAPSLSHFYRNALPVLASCLRATFVEVEMSSAGVVVHEQHSRGSVDPGFWSGITHDALTEVIADPDTCLRVFMGRDVDLSVALVTAPVRSHGGGSGAFAAIVPFSGRSELDGILETVGVLGALVASLSGAVGNTPERSEESEEDKGTRIQKVSSFVSEVELAYAITNKLRTRDGYIQVAMASVTGSHVQLLSVSGMDDISERSPGIRSLKAAMLECVDLGKSVVDQADGLSAEGVAAGARLHKQWRTSIGDACVASVPLRANGKIVAILSAQRTGAKPFTGEDIDDIREIVEPYAAGLELVRIGGRSLFRHIKESTSEALRTFMARDAWGRQLGLICVALLGAWSVFGTLPYSINAPCTLLPTSGRHLAASSDGILKALHAQPGDHVKAGDLLCEFETEALVIESERLRGELAGLDVDHYKALAEGQAAEAEMARASGRAIQASLDAVLHNIRSARVRAPVDGIILEGDHRTRLNDAFAKGDVLFRISGSAQWKVELRVPERDVDLLEAGVEGEFASHSRPGDRHALRLERVAPMAEMSEGKNVFVAEAICDMPEGWARSGLEGYASIDVGRRSPLWIVTHRLRDYLRMNLWL